METAAEYQNPDARPGETLKFQVTANTSDEDIARNIQANAALELPWLKTQPAHEASAVIIGGGPSAADHIDEIRMMQQGGAHVFAVNGASLWARKHKVTPNFQFIADAQEVTATLVDPEALEHIFASQVHPKTMASVAKPTVCHLGSANLMDHLPAEKLQEGGFAILGGGVSAGSLVPSLIYAMGYRDLHLFGLDSSYRNGKSHAYDQPMNGTIPCIEFELEGETFVASLPMKLQAEKLLGIVDQLKAGGCTLTVYGNGLFQALYNHRH